MAVSVDRFDVLSEFDTSKVWSQSSEILKSHLDPQIYAAWIKPLTLSSPDGVKPPVRELELIAPNKFCCEHVRRHYGGLISETLQRVVGREDLTLRFKAGQHCDLLPSSQPTQVRKTTEVLRKKTSSQDAINSNLNPDYNFSNFVVGACNQFAHAASLRVAESPGVTYNPLFIYGGVGLGKTHVVNAIGNACRRRGKKVLLVSSELFVNELIAALRSNRMPEFKNKFRSIDVLIIDDVQFLMGKERTQEEFFHTFNDLHQRHKQVILTSDTLPQDLVGLEERLRTRFASGLSADLQAPDFETRVAILAKKSESAAVELPDDVANYLAAKIDTNVRELEGALNRIRALASLHQTPITLSLAEQALESFFSLKKREVTPELIQRRVAERFKVSLHDLIGKRRTQNIAFARHVAMYMCRQLTTCSYPEIGAVFGGRDHSTVIHAFKSIEERLQQDQDLSSAIDSIKKSVY